MIWVVLVLESLLNARVASVDYDFVTGGVSWGKEREPHDVVPMGVAYQQVNATLTLPTRTLHEFNTKLSDA
jgi:hypothetical protein